MTLVKQTTLMMIVALSIIFICTLVITVNSSRTYFENQLEHNTQDTATALGLSMSKRSSNKMDTTAVLSTVSAVFDRGYFSSILVRNMDGIVLVKRYLKESRSEVPNWFVTLLHLKNEEQSALIMSGWQQIGEVVVKSDATVAYIALWLTAKKIFFLFLLTTVLVILISAFCIKIMFKSLGNLVQQAEDIGKKKFYTLDKLPRLKELRLLSNTMNSMVTKLQGFFTLHIEEIERLNAKANKDSLTGKGNRRYFFQKFNQYLSDEHYFLPGFLFLIDLSGLMEFNQRHGYQEGDQLIVNVSQFLDELFRHKHVFLFVRLDGPSFAVVILEQDRHAIESLLSDVVQKIDLFMKNKDPVLSLSIGVVRCKFSETATALLTLADKLIRTDKKQGVNGFNIEPDNLSKSLLDTQAWRVKIEEAIKKNAFHFYLQPVKSQHDIYHKECFIKLLSNSFEIAASNFFPIVQQYSLGGAIDQLVLQNIVKIKDPLVLAINLSSCTVCDWKRQEQFLLLVRQLTHSSKIKLHFELSEFILTENMTLAVSLIDELVNMGHCVGIDRVGATLIPLTYLKKVNIAYVKLDGSLSVAIETNKLKQGIIKRWIAATKRLDIILIATAIESKGQWSALNQLGILYFQGTYIQSPLLMK
ncbi:MAG: LapD/MoxY N-terminal periplasmic domain-containing protein [Legionellaceae bacterium]|nr:LapD/MoxY N-terminal periplasmic domain-containing protein [Legionellaceae bacterium]